MAEVLPKREIARLAVQRYDDVRRELRSGDLVFCSGSYVFSGLIQRFTRSVWSHVGIVYRDEHLQRVFILESETGIGVRSSCANSATRNSSSSQRNSSSCGSATPLRAWMPCGQRR